MRDSISNFHGKHPNACPELASDTPLEVLGETGAERPFPLKPPEGPSRVMRGDLDILRPRIHGV